MLNNDGFDYPVVTESETKKLKLLPLYQKYWNTYHFLDLSEMNQNQVAVTIHSSIYDKNASRFKDFIYSTDDFIEMLSNKSKKKINKESDSELINSGIYGANPRSDGYRKYSNFIQSHFIVLKFNNGKLSPEEFEKIFWLEASEFGKRSFIICNGFNRGVRDPNNFVVFMFYKSPIKRIQQHKTMFDDIANTLDIYGYSKEISGLDGSCRLGNKSFYMPCTNRLKPNHAFFRKYGLQGASDIQRYGIDFDFIYKSLKVKIKEVPLQLRNSLQFHPRGAERIIFPILDSMKEMNNPSIEHFHLVALHLRRLALTLDEIEYWCRHMADSKEEILKRIPDLSERLTKSNGTYAPRYHPSNVKKPKKTIEVFDIDDLF